METYEIHNRELLMRGLEKCAGPDCCKETCPYYGRARGSKSCRATLLEDAVAALTKDKDDLDALEAAANTYRDERDKLREGWHDLCDERDKMAKECEELKDYALAVEKEGQKARAERDKLNQEITCYIQQREQAGADLHVVREQNKNLRSELENLRETCRVQQDRLLKERDVSGKECASLTAENKALHERCQVMQNEINALVLKMGGKHDGKTDRPSVCDRELMEEVGKLIAQAKYQEGRADALAAIVERCSFGGGCCHE